jgi:hypothetical protein
MNDHACPKCQSTESIPDVRVIDHAHLNQPMELSATIYTNPDAWVFKGPISHRFRARVCGSCGYTEFYVEDPRGLLEWSRKEAKPRS